MERPRLTVQALYEACDCQSPLKVMSGYNGKVLCFAYKPEKHLNIGKREICALWAEIEVTKRPFGDFAKPALCCYVHGEEEYREEWEERE